MKRWMFTVLIIFFIGVFLVSAGILGKYMWDSHIQKQHQSEITQLVDRPETRPTPPAQAAPVSPAATGSTAPEETTHPEDTTSPYEYEEVVDPDTGLKIQLLKEYAELYKINNHLVGWIQIPGTAVNYPVLQNKDATDYYLHKDIYREYSRHGCIYVREACDVFAPSDNITIYGHRMKDGTMFHALNSYAEKEFYDEHKYIYFDTLTEYHTYEIIAVFVTTATKGEGFRYHAFDTAADAAEFDAFVSQCKALSLYDTGVTVEYGDKLITLSTCDYSVTNGRMVVVAKCVS